VEPTRGDALQRAEYLIGKLTEHSGEGFGVLDGQGKIVLPGPSVLGYESQDFQNRSAFDLAHPEDRARVLQAFQWMLANPGASGRVQYRARHADGSWHWLEVVGKNLLEDPGVAGIVVNFRDVTARRAAEQRMTAQYAVTRILAESSELHNIIPRVLAAIGETLDWQYGAFWVADETSGVLRFGQSWHAWRKEPITLEEGSRIITFA